ncbi:MAG: hypothetical protein N838_04635 [Thiohalocapsa sp. PB-PSB1]|nr:MAG: hypothetical protein N838_04635 [Thiohalocapsa sp. PB-PSB1]
MLRFANPICGYHRLHCSEESEYLHSLWSVGASSTNWQTIAGWVIHNRDLAQESSQIK